MQKQINPYREIALSTISYIFLGVLFEVLINSYSRRHGLINIPWNTGWGFGALIGLSKGLLTAKF